MARAAFIPGLESIRGLAALTVCLFHAAALPAVAGRPILDEASPLWFVLNGHGAVVLFFVLSGFVLRLSFGRRMEAPAAALTRGYLIARFFRLMPVIVATVFLTAALEWLVYGRVCALDCLARNSLLIDVTINNAFWTLRVEVFGSILIIIAFLLERRFGLWAVSALTALLIPLAFAGTSWNIGVVPTAHLHTFLLGYLLAAAPRISLSPRIAAVSLACALLAFFLANHIGFAHKGWMLLVTGLSSGAIVAVTSDRCPDLLRWPAVRWLGTVSYSFYAVHPLGMMAAFELLKSLDVGRPAALLMGLSVTLVVTVLVTIPMYYLVERVGMALGRAISKAPARTVTAG